jgi:methyltransferase (TIGR00027 family)
MYRAQESERPDALFHDPYARRLAGERGERILDTLPQGRRNSWPMVVRTKVLDDFVATAIAEGADTVLDLAAGLDARPWRLPLPPTLRWIDADLPGILDHKLAVLANETPRCRYVALRADLRDVTARRDVLAHAAAGSQRTLVITEGLLIYLEAPEVAALAGDLAAQTAFRWWVFDLVSPALLVRLSKQWGGSLDRANAPFRFAPADGTAFFRPHGWREREFRSTWLDAKRLHRRMPFAWATDLLIGLAPRARREAVFRFAGNVMLERDAG